MTYPLVGAEAGQTKEYAKSVLLEFHAKSVAYAERTVPELIAMGKEKTVEEGPADPLPKAYRSEPDSELESVTETAQVYVHAGTDAVIDGAAPSSTTPT